MYQCQTCIKYCLAFCYVYQPLCRLGLASSFDQQARGAVLDLTGDDNEEIRRSQNTLKWYVLSTSLCKNYSVPAKNTCSSRYMKICDKNYNIMIRKIICTIIMVHIIFQIRIAHGPYNHRQNIPILSSTQWWECHSRPYAHNKLIYAYGKTVRDLSLKTGIYSLDIWHPCYFIEHCDFILADKRS